MPYSWKAAEENASSPLPVSAGALSSGAANGKKAPAASMSRVPFHRLFAFANRTDAALMLLGAVGAMVNGVGMPLMAVLFGDLVDAFSGALSIHQVVNRISLVSPGAPTEAQLEGALPLETHARIKLTRCWWRSCWSRFQS
jgi:ATP-binding cassette subfamily B (MDR/TAP) protein 1